MLTLVADVSTPPEDRRRLPEPYTMREVRPSDAPALGRLYFDAYEPGVAAATLEDAVADIEVSLAGDYGPLWNAASPVATLGSEIVAAVLTVRRAPWDDVPDCPFVIETFTDRGHRRRGLARALLSAVLEQAETIGESAIALRVDSDNSPATRLYRSLGFRDYASR